MPVLLVVVSPELLLLTHLTTSTENLGHDLFISLHRFRPTFDVDRALAHIDATGT
jgi:hypothetical protein